MLILLIVTMLQAIPFHYTVIEDIPFAEVTGYWCESQAKDSDLAAQALMFSKVTKERDLVLTMDIYRPECEDKRPLVLLMHGGAFFANNKKSEPIASLGRDLAEQGYIVASFNYRMGFHLRKRSIRKAEDNALEDAASALEHLISNAEEYGIDTTRTFIGGASSGAITMLRLAARTEHRITGIIDMWGGVEDLTLLDASDVPIIAFHGDIDTTVPYTEGYPLGGKTLMSYLYGSKPLIEHRLELGYDASLVTLPGYAHAPYRNKDFTFNCNYEIIRDGIIDFLKRKSE